MKLYLGPSNTIAIATATTTITGLFGVCLYTSCVCVLVCVRACAHAHACVFVNAMSSLNWPRLGGGMQGQ